MREYRKFWKIALGVNARALRGGFSRSTAGKYVEKHQRKYIFLFTDLNSYARILAGHTSRLEKLEGKNPEQSLKIKYDDLDYGLIRKSSFHPVATAISNVRIRRLTRKDRALTLAFQKKCSSKDWQTLDLALTEDFALGLFFKSNLVGIARYAKMRSVPRLVDITVVVTRKARGQGYSTPLVSELVGKILKRGLTPKYRVAVSNVASRAIAEKLGFVPLYSLKTYQ
jgi:GNAT superfamily N-acetyltransferase